MLETLLKPNTGASLSGCVRWTQPMDGVRVCDFDCALTVPPESVSRDHYLTDTVRQVQEYMVSHLSDPLTIDQLSARFRISPTALKDIFRQTYGRPIHQYLLEKRVQHAAELLHRSSLSIVDIAAAVGYNSASQFGVAFKRRYQLTPSQYRRQARKS